MYNLYPTNKFINNEIKLQLKHPYLRKHWESDPRSFNIYDWECPQEK